MAGALGLQVISYNCGGLGQEDNEEKVKKLISDHENSVILVQEHRRKENHPGFFRSSFFGGCKSTFHVCVHYAEGDRAAGGGCLALFPKDMFDTRGEPTDDEKFSFEMLQNTFKCQIFRIVVPSSPQKDLILCNVHYRKGEAPQQPVVRTWGLREDVRGPCRVSVNDHFQDVFQQVSDWIRNAAYVCIAGDFNFSISRNRRGMSWCDFLDTDNLGFEVFNLWRTKTANHGVPEFTHLVSTGGRTLLDHFMCNAALKTATENRGAFFWHKYHKCVDGTWNVVELDDKGDEKENQLGATGHRPIFARFTFKNENMPTQPRSDDDGRLPEELNIVL